MILSDRFLEAFKFGLEKTFKQIDGTIYEYMHLQITKIVFAAFTDARIGSYESLVDKYFEVSLMYYVVF